MQALMLRLSALEYIEKERGMQVSEVWKFGERLVGLGPVAFCEDGTVLLRVPLMGLAQIKLSDQVQLQFS